MNKRIIYICQFFVFWLCASLLFAQQQKIADSLLLIYNQGIHSDLAKMELLSELSFHEIGDLQKGLQYAEELIQISENNGNKEFQRRGYFLKGNKLRLLGKLDEALAAYYKSVELSKQTNNINGEGEAYGTIADIYGKAGNIENAISYYRKAIDILRKKNGDYLSLASVILNTGDLFLKTENYDSVIIYSNEAKSIFEKLQHPIGIGYSIGNIGMAYKGLGNYSMAEQNLYKAISTLEEAQDYYPVCVYLITLSDIYAEKGSKKEALNLALRSLKLAEQLSLKEQIAEASLKLSQLYEVSGNAKDALFYYQKHINYRDSINNLATYQKMADLRTNYEVSQKQIEVNLLNQQKRNQKALVISLGIILFLTFIILFTLVRYNTNRRKAFEILNLQKQETELQKAKAEDALNELKVTQKHLVQSAKMASLGELTAGIAHEIKNPLNFVNNFSEVSMELIEELKEGPLQQLPPSDKENTDNIIKDLEGNLQKILTHGKRADSIVKGMLQHTGQSSGKREPADINAMTDEYIRLSYHGLNATEKGLIEQVHTTFDSSIPEVEVVSQEIGRVLMNILNNAYYAVLRKKDMIKEDYNPEIQVSTKKDNRHIFISIKDNGPGIPQKIQEKIFQPFFTTKPTGQGTGLGLSLSHDIIQAHGGVLKVESVEGEFTEFIIQLPLKANNLS